MINRNFKGLAELEAETFFDNLSEEQVKEMEKAFYNLLMLGEVVIDTKGKVIEQYKII